MASDKEFKVPSSKLPEIRLEGLKTKEAMDDFRPTMNSFRPSAKPAVKEPISNNKPK
jgi:hypothetical protein